MEQLQFSIRNADLTRILKSIGPAISPNPFVEAIGNVHVQVVKNELVFTGTNLNTTISIRCSDVDLNHSDISEALLPYKEMAQLTGKLPNTTLNILFEKTSEKRMIEKREESFTKYTATVTSEVGIFTFTCSAAKDFPMPKGDFNSGLAIPAAELKKAIGICWSSICADDLRPAMCCANFRISAGRCLVESTDGHSLARYFFDANNKDNQEIAIHRTACKLITPLLDDEEVTIQKSENLLRIAYLDAEITVRQIDGRFPDTDNAIPQNPEYKATFDSSEVVAALSRALISANSESKLIRFTFGKDKLTLRADDLQRGRDSKIEVALECDFDLEVGFNGSKLIELISGFKGKVRIELSAPNRAALFFPEEEKEATLLLMPMMINHRIN